MSRCFPFPPPGYEKKPIADEPDLLKKEKRKEKKHKKDKKDKEKKDKDRSEGKHKDKKDKKDKHRDKNKDKEKSKSSTPDEKKIYGQFEGCNGEKLHHNIEQNRDKISSSSDKKQSLQFQNGGDKRSPLQFTGQNGELVRNRSRGVDPENNKFVQELDRRIRDEEKGMGSHQFVGEGRKSSVNKVEIQKMGGQQLITDGVVGFGGNPMVGGNPTIQNKINGATPPVLDHRRIEQKEKIQEKENDDKRGDKRKHKDRDKQRQEKDKDTEKVKKDKKDRKEERSKEKSEQKKAERDKNKLIKKSDPITAPNCLPAHSLETSFQGVGSEGIHKKRKDMESNGVFHENEPRPNKMARHISNISPENGRRINFPQSPSSSLQGASQGASPNSFKVGSKGQRVNGMIVSQPDLVPAKKRSVSPFNHLPTKPSLIKSPPVITNHVTAQSPPIPTTKPQPNHIAARLSSPKPPPSIPNPVTQTPPRSSTSPLVPRPKPPSAVVNKVAAAAPPPTHFNKVAAAAPPPAHFNKVSTPPPPPPPSLAPPPPPALVNKAAAPPPPPSPAVINKVAAPSLPVPKKKPPHPDTKYLSRILTVPKLDQWCGDDNQEWLFNSKEGPTLKKPPTEDPQVQVWSEAKHIESVDVCALPYVIPY